MHFYSRKLHFGLMCLISSLGLLLAACGASGPSRSDAEAALEDYVSELSKGMGQWFGTKQPANKIKVKVMDLKCGTAGGAFDCQVLYELQGQQVNDRFQFTNLGGKWRATPKK